MSEVLDRLKEALQGAKEVIQEQREALEILTAQPRPQAVVVDVRDGGVREDAKPEEFMQGSRVKATAVRNMSPTGVVGLLGTIIKDDLWLEGGDYDVQVKLDNGKSANFGIGRVRGGKFLPRELDIVIPGAVIVNFQGQRLELEVPRGLSPKVGDTVSLSAKTMQILDVVADAGIGETVIVRQPVDERHSEVDWQGGSRVVVHTHALGKVDKGDRVVLDPTAAVIVRNLGRGEERFLFESATKVSWDDIGGLLDAKTELREAVELPYTEADLYRHYAYSVPKGVLLFGPPRCGKTMLGKAVATSVAKALTGKSESKGFFYVKGSEILDKYVGVAEGLVRHLFNRARFYRKAHGHPAVIFIDEADAIMYKRGTGISSDVERTIVPAFLAEMDGLEESGAIVLLATNRADTLDPAIVGDGRIDRRIMIPRPDRDTALHIARLNLATVPLTGRMNRDDAAKLIVSELFDRPRPLRELIIKNGGITTLPFTLRDIRNGAMVVSAISHAKSLAMRRDRAARKRTGVCEQDWAAALDMLVRENLHLNHDDAVREVIETLPAGARLVDMRMPASAGTGGA